MTGLFLKILNMSISAAWLVLAVIVLRLFIKKAPKWATLTLWELVGLRLIMPFSIKSALSLIPSAETVSPDIMYAETPEIHSGISAFNSTVNPVIIQEFAPNPGDSVNPLQIWLTVAAAVWLTGMAVMLICAVISTLKLRKRVSDAAWYGDNIYRSPKITSPFVMGIFKPKIYLPENLSAENEVFVKSHEQAHISRHDNLIKPLGYLLLAVHWFNPVLWAAYVLLCRDIEFACDERVIKTISPADRANYSEALLECSAVRRTISVCPVAFGEVSIKTRIKKILNYRKPAFWITITALVLCIAAAVCFLTDPKEKIEKGFPWQHSYVVKSVIYQNPLRDFAIIPSLNASQYAITEDMTLLTRSNYIDYWSSVGWSSVGKLEEFELTKDNFDDYFRIDSSTGWEKGQKASKIRKENEKAWRLIVFDILYYLLLQKNGEVILTYGYYDFEAEDDPESDDSSISWLLRLEQDYHKDTGMIISYGKNSIPMLGCDTSKPLKSIKETLYTLNADLAFDKTTHFTAFCDGHIQHFLYAIYDAETLDLICGYTSSQKELTRENIEPGKDYIVLAKHDPEYSDNDVDVWGFIAHVPLTRFYNFDQSSIVLNENGSFTFTFSLLSSYIGIGGYEEENGRLTLRTGDSEHIYEFDMVDDTLVFDAEASSKNLWYSGMFDGCVFEPLRIEGIVNE